jgi:hypothetical protein
MIIKSIVIILIIIIAVCSLSACNDLNEDSPSPSVNDQNEIFPYGDFFTLQEAYDLGYLTVQDLESIAYYCNGGLRWYETDDILDPWKSEPITDYEPIAKNPEILGAETENKIKQTWIYYLNDNLTIPSDVTIDYYGTHNNCVAIWLTATHYGYTQAIWYSTVAGVTFCYNNGNSIKIWVEHVSYSNFYTLQEAYDLGYLTHEDLESIAYYRNEGLRWYEADDILYPWESEPVSEDYTPIPKNPEKLDAERKIKLNKLGHMILIQIMKPRQMMFLFLRIMARIMVVRLYGLQIIFTIILKQYGIRRLQVLLFAITTETQ